jgi:hypothetical protein
MDSETSGRVDPKRHPKLRQISKIRERTKMSWREETGPVTVINRIDIPFL